MLSSLNQHFFFFSLFFSSSWRFFTGCPQNHWYSTIIAEYKIVILLQGQSALQIICFLRKRYQNIGYPIKHVDYKIYQIEFDEKKEKRSNSSRSVTFQREMWKCHYCISVKTMCSMTGEMELIHLLNSLTYGMYEPPYCQFLVEIGQDSRRGCDLFQDIAVNSVPQVLYYWKFTVLFC